MLFKNLIRYLEVVFIGNHLPAALASPIVSKSNHVTRQSYRFDALSSRNVAVYFGRTDETARTNLTNQCTDENVDIVVLAFVTDVLGGGDYPNMAFDNLCSGQTDEMITVGATGLLACDALTAQIAQCQTLGKKVLLGIGGQHGNTTFSTAIQAQSGAGLLWDLFGGGSGKSGGLRPFGEVQVDGFDVDNETGNGEFYTTFVKTMRSLYESQNAKSYYLSAAPTCYLSDDTQHSYLNLMDWVWPQFYGAPSCNIGSPGFVSSVRNWTSLISGPKLFIGSPAWAEGTSNGGYVAPYDLSKSVQEAQKVAGAKFGGVMLWDAAYGHINLDTKGKDYIYVVKAALRS